MIVTNKTFFRALRLRYDLSTKKDKTFFRYMKTSMTDDEINRYYSEVINRRLKRSLLVRAFRRAKKGIVKMCSYVMTKFSLKEKEKNKNNVSHSEHRQCKVHDLFYTPLYSSDKPIEENYYELLRAVKLLEKNVNSTAYKGLFKSIIINCRDEWCYNNFIKLVISIDWSHMHIERRKEDSVIPIETHRVNLACRKFGEKLEEFKQHIGQSPFYLRFDGDNVVFTVTQKVIKTESDKNSGEARDGGVSAFI